MKGFTLIEVGLVLFIVVLTFSMLASFKAFNKDLFYLKEIVKGLSVALNVTGDLTQRINSKDNNFFCAAGIYFPDPTSFEALAFATTTKLCKDLIGPDKNIDSGFINSNLSKKTYVLQNGDLVNDLSFKGLLLNKTLKPGYEILFSNTANCDSIYYPPLIFMYIYSYNDLFFVLQQNGANGWQKINTDEIYICLTNKNMPEKESYIIKLSKLGQLTIVK